MGRERVVVVWWWYRAGRREHTGAQTIGLGRKATERMVQRFRVDASGLGVRERKGSTLDLRRGNWRC